MATGLKSTSIYVIGFDDFKARWHQCVLLGILLVILGMVAIGATVAATLISVLFVGCLMISAGILQVAHAVSSRHWGGHIIDLLSGLLSGAVGLMIVANPSAAAAAITLLVAAFLIFGGTFRMAVGLTVPFHHQLWVVIHGTISVILGMLVLFQWPLSGQWVIGLFVGIDMLFNGWTLIALGLAAKRLGTK